MPLFRLDMTINGITWTIEYVEPNNPILRRNNGTWTIGCTDSKARTIYINNRLNNYMNQKVLTHEICHALIFSYGIYFDLQTEELICDFIATYGLEIIELVEDILYNVSRNTNIVLTEIPTSDNINSISHR